MAQNPDKPVGSVAVSTLRKDPSGYFRLTAEGKPIRVTNDDEWIGSLVTPEDSRRVERPAGGWMPFPKEARGALKTLESMFDQTNGLMEYLDEVDESDRPRMLGEFALLVWGLFEEIHESRVANRADTLPIIDNVVKSVREQLDHLTVSLTGPGSTTRAGQIETAMMASALHLLWMGTWPGDWRDAVAMAPTGMEVLIWNLATHVVARQLEAILVLGADWTHEKALEFVFEVMYASSEAATQMHETWVANKWPQQ